jgi:hypothetical protein
MLLPMLLRTACIRFVKTIRMVLKNLMLAFEDSCVSTERNQLTKSTLDEGEYTIREKRRWERVARNKQPHT